MKKTIKILLKKRTWKQILEQTFVQALVLILIAELSVMALPAMAGEIVVDNSAPGAKPTLDKAQNGVPVVNLATVNGNGVSHNKFTDYNVNTNGVILNNSTAVGVSQLGGALYANPNYTNGRAASLVINEVTGNRKTNLFGYTEMFGQRADFILANPNGIVVNGAGFINIPRVTLGTGIPMFNNGNFQGLDIRGGSVLIEGSGLDASQADYFSIVTRMASLNAPIWGKDVSIITGTGLYNYNNAVFTQKDTPDGKPEFAIDASALGSIYAGRISLICNEKGVGVRSNADMLADVSDIRISADGKIELKNMQASNDVNVASASGEIVQTGTAMAVNELDYSAAKIKNIGTLIALKRLTITGGLIDNQAAVIKSGGSLDIYSTGDIDNNTGTIASNGNTNINTDGSFNNESGEIASNGDVNINTNGNINNNSGTIASNEDVSINTNNTLNNEGGTIAAGRNIDINANTAVNNNEGKILLSGTEAENINISTGGMLRNTNGEILLTGTETGSININGIDSIDGTGGEVKSSGGIIIGMTGDITLNDTLGNIYADKTFTLNAANVVNERNLEMNGDININAGGNITNNAGKSIVSNSTVKLVTGNLLTNSGSISGESLNIKAAVLENSGEITGGDGNSTIDVTGDIYNYNRLSSASDLNINAANINNTPGMATPDIFAEISSGANLTVEADSIYNKDGLIFSAGNMKLTTANLENRGVGTYIYSMGNMEIMGKEGRVNKLLNYSGHIESDKDLTINLGADGKLENTGEDIGNYGEQWVNYNGYGDQYYVYYGSWSNRNNPLYYIPEDYIDYFYNLYSLNYYLLYYPYVEYYSLLVKQGYGNGYSALLQEKSLNPGSMQTISGNIVSQKNMNITAGEVKNHGSVISSNENMTITTNKLINEANYVNALQDQHFGMRTVTYYRMLEDKTWDGGGTDDLGWVPGSYAYSDSWSYPTVKVYSNTKPLIQAGGNLTINNAGGTLNNSGKIQAGNTVNIVSGSVTNSGTISNGAFGATSGSNISANTAYNNLEDLQNTGTIDISDYVDIDTGNLMFIYNTDPGTAYLIETRSQFIDVSKLMGSSYLFERIGYNPDSETKLLGDAYYEQQLVMKAIYQVTSEKYLSEDIKTDQEEMKYLLDNAAAAYRDLKLTVGVELTKEQINSLQEPIIWYVEEKIKGITVLVPKIYIPEYIVADIINNSIEKTAVGSVNIDATGGLVNSGLIHSNNSLNIKAGKIINTAINGSAAKITGKDVNLVSIGDIINTSSIIKAEKTLTLNAVGNISNKTAQITGQDVKIVSGQDITNTGGVIKADNTLALKAEGNISNTTAQIAGQDVIISGQDITNTGGIIKADNTLALKAKGNITNETLVNTTYYSNGEVRSSLGNVATIESGGNLSINAGGDFTNIAAKVKSGGDAELNVEGTISFETVKLHEVTQEKKHGVKGTTNRTTSEGSSLEVGGDLEMKSDSDIYFIGSTADVKGNADVQTAGNLNLINDYDEESFYGKKTEKKSFGRKKTTTVSTYDTTIVASVFKTGGNLNVNAGNDVNVIGSNITSDGNMSVNTEGSYNIIAAYEEHNYKKSTTKSGFGTGGSIYGSVKKTDMTRDSNANASSLEIKGKYASHSKKDTNIVGSNITASEAEITTDGNLNIVAAYDKHDEQHTTEKSGWGGGGGKNMFSMEMTDKGSGYTQAKGSTITAGKLTLKSGNDILVEGSTINANDATIDAAGNFMEISAQNTSYSYEVSQTASVTSASGFKKIAMSALTAGYTSRNEISFEKDGKFYKPKSETVQFENGRFFVEMGRADYHKLDTKTNQTTQTSSSLNIANTLTINAGKDITIAGSDINVGGDAALNAVGNINILSAEETERTRTEEITGSAVVTMGAKNAWVDVAYAGKAVYEAKKQLDDAKKDYNHYKDQLKKAKEDLKKGLIDQEDYDSMADQEKYYKANIVLLAENLVAKTGNLALTTLSAIANSSHYGFTGDIQLDVSGSITKSTEFATLQKSSNIWTGGNLALISGETAKIQGSNVASGGDMLIDAQNVEILSAQNTTMSSSDTKSAHINVTINMGGGGGFSADFGMSGMRSDSTAHVNSHLSGSNITIRSKQDTTVRGGNVYADNNLDLNVGGNLLVESVQDKSSSGSYSFGLSGGYSSSSSKSGSSSSSNVGASFSVSESKSRWVNEQSGLIGGNVNIYVENKTTLKGAVIASTSSDPANLKLDTGSFEYINVKDKSTSFNIGASVGFSTSTTEKPTGIPATVELQTSKRFNASASYGYTDKRQTNFATIGEGTIIVRDGNSDLSKLHRDVATAQYGTFDVGTKGVTGVDTKLISDLANFDERKAEFLKGYENAKNTIIDVVDTTKKIYTTAGEVVNGIERYVDNGFRTDGEVKEILKQYVEYKSNPLMMASAGGGLADDYLKSALSTRSEFMNEYSDLINANPDMVRFLDGIKESKKMWSSGEITMDKIYTRVLERETTYVKNIQDSYTDRNVRNSDGNPNNVLEYSGDGALGRYMYYEAKLVQSGSIGSDGLATMLEHNIPIVLGEQNKGANLYATDVNNKPTGDVYNDRITKISTIDGVLQIDEYNRANVDVSILSKNPSVATGVYDFIVGEHSNKTPALNIFTFDNIGKLTNRQQQQVLDKLDNNTFTYQDAKYNYPQLRVLPAENGKTQNLINEHGGSPNYTDSAGCLTIYNMDANGSKTNPNNDYQRFINSFDQNQLGKQVIIRGK